MIEIFECNFISAASGYLHFMDLTTISYTVRVFLSIDSIHKFYMFILG